MFVYKTGKTIKKQMITGVTETGSSSKAISIIATDGTDRIIPETLSIIAYNGVINLLKIPKASDGIKAAKKLMKTDFTVLITDGIKALLFIIDIRERKTSNGEGKIRVSLPNDRKCHIAIKTIINIRYVSLWVFFFIFFYRIS